MSSSVISGCIPIIQISDDRQDKIADVAYDLAKAAELKIIPYKKQIRPEPNFIAEQNFSSGIEVSADQPTNGKYCRNRL